ncbi:hypothetical protein Q3G72_031747 [Acer saccharum]|nr:hypothetical protein Q3G72_031747 [Acer saccharum]
MKAVMEAGNGYERERDYGYRDDDQYGRNGDSYSCGRDYDDRYGSDSYRDDDSHGGSRNVDRYQDSSGRNSNRYRAFGDDSQSSCLGSGGRALC